MYIFVRLAGGRQVFIEHARWAEPERWFSAKWEGAELILWLGRLHLIYTPASWSMLRGVADGGGPALRR